MGSLPVAYLPVINVDAPCPEGTSCRVGVVGFEPTQRPALVMCASEIFGLETAYGCFIIEYAEHIVPADWPDIKPVWLGVPMKPIEFIERQLDPEHPVYAAVALAAGPAVSAGGIALPRDRYEVAKATTRIYLCCGSYGTGYAEYTGDVAVASVPLFDEDAVYIPSNIDFPLVGYRVTSGEVAGGTWLEKVCECSTSGRVPVPTDGLILVGQRYIYVQGPSVYYVPPRKAGEGVEYRCIYSGCQVTGCDMRGWRFV